MIHIYTDGSSSGDSTGPGGWAFAVFDQDGNEIHCASRGTRVTTNNRMEMLAIAHALHWADGRECLIHTDSQLCIDTLTKWAPGWERAGWKKKTPGEIANLDIVQKVLPLFRASRATFKKVKGHAGIPGNERVDQLAGDARRQILELAVA